MPVYAAIAPWSEKDNTYYFSLLYSVGQAYGFELKTPWKDLTEIQKNVLLLGSDKPILIQSDSRFKANSGFERPFEGILPILERQLSEANGESVRQKLEKYLELVPCKTCSGKRLRPEALAVKIEGAGCDTMISLRPERVVVNPDSDKFPNRLSAKVEELIYLGDHIRSRMNVCGHDDFIVKIPNSAQHAQLEPGQTVQVGWLAEDSRALDVPVSS